MAAGSHSPHVVGLGASAGGLEALKTFFGAMPPTTGVAFVVVVHLDPRHKGLMPELLGHVTGLTVVQAEDGQSIEADHVYVIPPSRTLAVHGGILHVREVADRRGLRGVIDAFFRSLAEDRHDRAVAIVLSGTGTEGTLGVRAIKAGGGLAMAQAPETAVQPGMPTSAIATGLVDVVDAPAKLPAALLTYLRSSLVKRAAAPETPPLDDLATILNVLRARTKHDFRGYKKGTLQRRVERRIALHQISTAAQYADMLRSHPAEVDQLVKDFRIGVTSFFRDPQVFDELAGTALSPLIRGRDTDGPLRIWVPGCSTGEEAYSMAIVVAEQLAAAQVSRLVQIFATDVDADALAVARAGAYPESIALDVSPQRLQRFFTHEDHRYTIAKSLRESVVFAVQNLTSDPPFSKLDLISCRNVLIYLEPDTQERLLRLFHFALNPDGYLLLGNAEGIGALEELFTPLSKRHRLFQRVGPVARPAFEFPVSPLDATDASRVRAQATPDASVATTADRQLLHHFAPAAVVVRATGQVVRFYGAMERYITLPTGDATLDVLTLARDPIKPLLRAALHDAVRRHREVVVEGIDVRRGRGRTTLRLTVAPLSTTSASERLWLVLFEDVPASAPTAKGAPEHRHAGLVRRLESELRATKKDQQSLVGQLELSNEELKAANEEVLSMNEELQSTNEELTTLNAQLQDKVHELTDANDDLANLLMSSDIATVFLDTDLRVKRFTTAASQVLNLRPADAGRPMNHIAPNLVDVDLSGMARSVLDSGTPVEREVVGQDGRQFISRALPYRVEGKPIQGVVLTFIDVTTLKQSERELRTAREQLAEDLRRTTRLQALGVELLAPGDMSTLLSEIVRAALDVTHADMGHIQLAGDDGRLTIAAQSGFDPPFLERFARVDAHADCICGRALADRARIAIEDVTATPSLADADTLAAFHAAGVRAMQSTPLLSPTGRLIGMLSTHYRAPHAFDAAEGRWLDQLAVRATHLIDRAQLEAQLRQTREQLERLVSERTRDLDNALDGAQAGTWHIDLGANRVMWDERSRAMFGASVCAYAFDPTFPEVHPDDRARLQERFEAIQTPGDDRWDVEFRVVRPDGAIAWIHAVGRVIRGADGRPTQFNGVNLDVTERMRAQASLAASRRHEQETADALASLFAATTEGILVLTARGEMTQANPALHAMFGYAPGELIGQPLERLVPEAARSVHAHEHAAFWAQKRSRRMGTERDIFAQRKDGTLFPVEVGLTHVATPAPDGRVFAVVADITDRKRADDQARRSHDELQHRTDQLRRMATDLAVAEHRTREQLAKTLHDGLQQLLFGAKLRLERMATALDARDMANRLAQVTRDVTDAIAAARTLAVDLYPPPLHNGGLLVAVTWLAEWVKERYGLTVEVTADPQATMDTPAQKDRLLLAFESLRELLFDVVKHAQVHHATVNLALTPDGQLRITVADHGVGFDATAALAQASTTSGWGLFRIRERADLLGGSLQIESAPGRGTRFVLTIPRGEAAVPSPTRALRVLIADDHAVARAGLRELLAARPELEIVGEATTGAEAVAQAEALRPDAIVMDVSMPEMDGVEATRRIHSALPAIQIVGLSSHTESAHALQGAGAVGYFTKGDDAQQLVDRLLAFHAERASTPTST